MPIMDTKDIKLYQFAAELKDYKPRMWRRILVPETFAAEDVCYVVLNSFLCNISHLYQLIDGETYYTVPAPYEERMEDVNIIGVKIPDIFYAVGKSAVLEYDFGDGWEFKLTLEAVGVEPTKPLDAYPLVTEGKGFGIMDDCGGVYSLMEINAWLKGKNPEMDEYAIDWACGFLGIDKDNSMNFNLDYMYKTEVSAAVKDWQRTKAAYHNTEEEEEDDE